MSRIDKNHSKPKFQTNEPLDCIQKPFPALSNTTKSNDRFAYVWYATQNTYLCSALAALKHLQNLRASQTNPDLNVDYVLIYSEGDLRDVKQDTSE